MGKLNVSNPKGYLARRGREGCDVSKNQVMHGVKPTSF